MNTLLKKYGFNLNLGPADKGGGNGDEGNEGDGGAGDGGGASGGDGAGDSGGDGGDGKPPASRTSRIGGLFGNRKNGDGGEGGDDGQGDGTGEADLKPGADGRPAGLAEKFWDPAKKEIRVDALIKAQTDAEKALGELKRSKTIGGEVPEDPADYFKGGIELPDEMDARLLPPDDPGLSVAANVFKKHGIGKDIAAAVVKDMFAGMSEHLTPPIDPEQEMQALGKGGPQLVDGLFVWVEGMERAGDLSEDDIDVIEGMMMTAKGARLLAKFRNLTGEKPIPIDPGNGAKGMSLDQLDEAYKAAVKAKDYKEQERLDELRNRINPDGQNAGISGQPGGYNI